MANLTDMLSKFVSSNTASSSGSGTLPSNTITNSKEDLKGITTRSGVAYQGPTIPTPSKVVKTRNRGDQGPSANSKLTNAPRPNLKPSIPYPSRRDNERHHDQANEQIKKFNEIFKDMSFEISFTDALILMLKFASTLKALIGNKEKLSEMARTPMNEHSKRSKSGHRFGFVRFKNVNDISMLVSNLRVTWMGGFHLFVDVTKYGRTNNRLKERSGDIKPNEVGVSGNNDASNSGEKPVGVSVSNTENEESSNEALMFISKDDCIDLDGMERSILAKVKDLSVIMDLLKYMSSEGFVNVGLRYVGGRWVWLEFDSTDQVESIKNSKVLNELFLELKDISYDFIPDERCVWIDLVGLPLASWAPEVCVLTESLHRVLESFKVSNRNRSYCITVTEFAYWAPNIESMKDKSIIDSLERKDDEGPSLDGGPKYEEPLDFDNYDSVSSKDDNNDSDSSSEMSSTSRLMREVDVRGVDSDHVDSFEEGEIIEDHFDGDRRNDTIEDNADVNPSTNVCLDVNQNTSIPEVVEDFSSLDRTWKIRGLGVRASRELIGCYGVAGAIFGLVGRGDGVTKTERLNAMTQSELLENVVKMIELWLEFEKVYFGPETEKFSLISWDEKRRDQN
nr:hypothetical protein [Tanacetum cinerariifolium]